MLLDVSLHVDRWAASPVHFVSFRLKWMSVNQLIDGN